MSKKNNASHLSLLTFNTLGAPLLAYNIAKRYEKTAEIINKHNIDIVCLQELFTYPQYLLFKNFLPQYPYVAYKKHWLGPKGGVVIFSKMPLEDCAFIKYAYPKHAHVPLHTKLLSFGMLHCKVKDKPLTLIVTHLTSDILTHNLTPKEKLYPLIRSQLHEAAHTMNARSQGKNAVLLVGDFNIAAKSALYSEFMEITDAVDTFKHLSGPTYLFKRLHYPFATPANNRIDFIFLKQNQTKFDIIATQHLFEKEVPLSGGTMSYLSDHVGLQITFSTN